MKNEVGKRGTDLGVVDEAVSGAGVGGQLAGAGELEALDDGGLAGPIWADDEGERLEEGDDVLVLRAEAPDALDKHLVHRTHPCSRSLPSARAALHSSRRRSVSKVLVRFAAFSSSPNEGFGFGVRLRLASAFLLRHRS